MLHAMLHFWFQIVHDWGYAGVVLLMAMESSIFPVPSEVVVPPAAYWAAQGKMTWWGVWLAGTAGSWLGAAITFWVSMKVGRPVIARWGHFIFLSPAKLDRAEHFMRRYESAGIFFARLLPVVRHVISIPAGLVRMNFWRFSLMTVLGSAIWCGVLTWLGWKLGIDRPGAIEDPAMLVTAIKADALWIVLAIAVLAALYFLMLRLTAPRQYPPVA